MRLCVSSMCVCGLCVCVNVCVCAPQTLANPSDPLLQSLTASSYIMSPRMCGTGEPTPTDLNPQFPLWFAGDTPMWVEAMRSAIRMSETNGSTFVSETLTYTYT